MPHPAPPTPRARRCGQHLPIVCRHLLLNRAGCWLKERRCQSVSDSITSKTTCTKTFSCVSYQGCSGATCREIISLQPAPRAQITSWPTGSVALLRWRTQKNEMYEKERSRGRDLGDPPVGHSLQSSAVAAGQPEGAVGQQVGAVGDLQDQQVAS